MHGIDRFTTGVIEIMLISAQGTDLPWVTRSSLQKALFPTILDYVTLLTGYVSYLIVSVTRYDGIGTATLIDREINRKKIGNIVFITILQLDKYKILKKFMILSCSCLFSWIYILIDLCIYVKICRSNNLIIQWIT